MAMKQSQPLIRTEGGTFDPSDNHLYFIALQPSEQQSFSKSQLETAMLKTDGKYDRTDDNLYFIAAGPSRLIDGAPVHDNLLVAVNQLYSDENLLHVEGWLQNGNRVFLDSGIFSLTTDYMREYGTTFNETITKPPEDMPGFDKLFDRYIELVLRYRDRLWGYVELDLGGKENKIKTRKKLEAMGLRPVPVFHPLVDGWDYFDYLARNYDRVCISNFASGTDRPTRKRLVATAWERHRKYPHVWIHLLGLTPNEWLNAFPANSCDSSAWLSSVKWSGYKEKTMLSSFGEMPKNFQYVLGSDNESEHSSKVGARMAAYGAYMLEQNWKNHLSALEQLEFDTYSLKGE